MPGQATNILAAAWDDRRGTSFIELSILMPVLLLLALGVAEFGRALQHHHVINKSVRDAARYLARVPATCPTGGGTGAVVNPADLVFARNLALTGYAVGGDPILAYWDDPSTIEIVVECFDNSAGDYRGRPDMPIIRVSAAVPYEPLGYLQFLVGAPALTFGAEHQQLWIGA